MAELKFMELDFEEEKEKIRINFLRNYYTQISKEELRKISDFLVNGNIIDFKGVSIESAGKKFNFILLKAFENLRNKITGKKTTYIHQNSGIPLIGNVSFGIVDRDTSLIEIKPATGCNLNCIYCSVNQDLRERDFVIEKDYLVQELKKLIEFKAEKNIEVHIGVNGEPLLYAPLCSLIKDISGIKEVSRISMDTNGTLLSEKKADELIKAGLTQFNLSINAIDAEIAKKIAGTAYKISDALNIAGYIAKKCDIIITPVLIPGINEPEIPKIIEFAKSLKAKNKNLPVVGIQNFLNYRFGKNPVKQIKFEEFYKRMKELENKHRIRLIFSEKDFGIRKTKKLPKPFKKGDRIDARIACNGRQNNEMIAAAKQRTITIPECSYSANRAVKIEITRSKHNIFFGKLIR